MTFIHFFQETIDRMMATNGAIRIKVAEEEIKEETITDSKVMIIIEEEVEVVVTAEANRITTEADGVENEIGFSLTSAQNN